MKRYALVLSIVACVVLFGCPKPPQRSWVEAIQDCGKTDINSDKILYFGPSNNVGPGSVWRETFDDNKNHVDYLSTYKRA